MHLRKQIVYLQQDKSTIQLTLESKYNIVDVQLPQCSYTLDFCRFNFKSTECSWSLGAWVSGGPTLEPSIGYYRRLNALGNVILSFPIAEDSGGNTCDHTLMGANGCQAHNNILRYGGFPTIARQ